MFKYEMLVMGFLDDRPMHGYQIEREIRTHRMDSWAQIVPCMVHKTLTNLKQDGMIGKLKIEGGGRLPEKRVYQLTSEWKERMAKLVENSLIKNDLTKDLSKTVWTSWWGPIGTISLGRKPSSWSSLGPTPSSSADEGVKKRAYCWPPRIEREFPLGQRRLSEILLSG